MLLWDTEAGSDHSWHALACPQDRQARRANIGQGCSDGRARAGCLWAISKLRHLPARPGNSSLLMKLSPRRVTMDSDIWWPIQRPFWKRISLHDSFSAPHKRYAHCNRREIASPTRHSILKGLMSNKSEQQTSTTSMPCTTMHVSKQWPWSVRGSCTVQVNLQAPMWQLPSPFLPWRLEMSLLSLGASGRATIRHSKKGS